MEVTSNLKFSSISIFCGSNPGKSGKTITTAYNLGKILAERNIKLIYGGGSCGLMGYVAKCAYEASGQVQGIIPSALTEPARKTIRDEVQVSNLTERMNFMLDKSNAFIALPGGFGTLEKIFHMVSWSQLNIHQKPIGLLNINGFYDGLLNFIDHAVEQHFITPSARGILMSASKAEDLLDILKAYVHEPDPAVARIEWSKGKKRKLIMLGICPQMPLRG